MEIKQHLKLSQQLVMTPQLQQAIRLLQLSRLDLIDEIKKELDANPILSDEETESYTTDLYHVEGNGVSLASMAERLGSSSIERRIEHKQIQAIDWEQLLENQTLQKIPEYRSRFEDPPTTELLTNPADALIDHLRFQLQLSDFIEEERYFAELVLGNLDDDGFLDLKGIERENGERTSDLTVEDLAQEAGLHPEDAHEVLAIMQRWDPIGCCTSSLTEYLQVQAEVLGYDEIEQVILKKHLHHLEKHHYQVIAKDLKVPIERIYEAVKEIRKLNFRPAQNFTREEQKNITLIPDVYVISDGGKWIVLDNDRGIQRLHINNTMVKQILDDPQHHQQAHTKNFICEKVRNAQWLIRSIEQRRKTIIKVTQCIVEKQLDFFEYGIAYLKPLVLRDIAEAIGMHESTVSRVTANKYVHTPQGIFELRYFFNSSIRRTAEENIASESVKQAIKKMIEEEDKSNPLSDQQLVELLSKRQGIQIARRTIAKYRDMLGILASSHRKRVF
ncbi:RNA polymerase factor sigma-54 [Pajaroellobacter abortibovis]|nr:RNA polymerase factor sigma-54 [Pajaroellobacter abortibovis]